MAKLDFSGINKIAYRGFEDQGKRDAIIDQGYVVVTEMENPFNGPQEGRTAVLDQHTADAQTQSKSPSERLKKAFTGNSGKRSYSTFYRVAHDFHEKHHPPTVNRGYWRDHRLGEDDIPPEEIEYWKRAAQDAAEIARQYGNDPFLTDLLVAVYEELEREYKCIRGS